MNKYFWMIFVSMLSFSCVDSETDTPDSQNPDSKLIDNSKKVKLINERIKLPKIDGNIKNGEWTNASKYKLFGGDSIYFIKSNDTVFVALRGNSGGFTSMGFANDTNLKILHASTGLITAEYKKNGDDWILLYDFKEPLKDDGKKYPRNEERLSENYKNSHLKQFGWYANLIEMGASHETEFLIPLSALPQGDLRFSVVFYQFKSTEKKARFPDNLDDGMLDQELISGTAKNGIKFKTKDWEEFYKLF